MSISLLQIHIAAIYYLALEPFINISKIKRVCIFLLAITAVFL